MFCITQTVINNKLTLTASSKYIDQFFTYAFYIHVNEKIVKKIMYSDNNRIEVNLLDYQGALYIKCFFRNEKNSKISTMNADFISIPRQLLKIDEASFESDLNVDILIENTRIPINFFRKTESKKLYVLLNGALALDVQKKYYPYFNRISWHNRFDGHCLYMYDASLNMQDRYELGWYRGSREDFLHHKYTETIKYAAKCLNIAYKDIVLYGSSGGGFAALKFAEDISGATAVAINPQTNIVKYNIKNAVNNFNNLFDIENEKSATIVDTSKFETGGSRFFIVQNTQDNHHYEEHFKPLWQQVSMKNEGWCSNNHNYALLYDHESGHGGEPSEVFEKIIDLIADI